MHHRCRRPHPGKQNPQTRPSIPYSNPNVHIHLNIPQAGIPQHIPGIPTSAGYLHTPISSALVEALGPLNVSLSVLDLTSVLKKVAFIQPDFVSLVRIADAQISLLLHLHSFSSSTFPHWEIYWFYCSINKIICLSLHLRSYDSSL